MNFKTLLGKQILYFDGAMGTEMAKMGILGGHAPEDFNIKNPDAIYSIHKNYLDAGADIITANTFGATSIKYKGEFTLNEVITEGVNLAKKAIADCGRTAFVALDMGPTGKLLEPMGDLTFENAYNAFAEQAKIGEQAGADLVIIETFSDLYECKSTILAIKENTSLPLICTVTLGENGRTLTGANIQTVVAVLEGLRCDAIGLNCSLGPDKLMPFIKELLKTASIPVLIQPNAGLPQQIDGKTVYDITPEMFAEYGLEMANCGASLLGGCCGTTPTHIRLLKQACAEITYTAPSNKGITVASSGTVNAIFGKDIPIIIGERLNTSGKEDLTDAVKSEDYDTLVDYAMEQADAGANLLDFNLFVPETDEIKIMTEAVKYVQSMVNTPLILDSLNTEVLAKTARIYNGKPIFNSVIGEEVSMKPIFEAVSKYGGIVIGMCMDRNGLPKDANQRLEIGKRIIDTASMYGIDKKDIILDPVISAALMNQENLIECINSIKLIKESLGVKTIIGISNVSYQMPKRSVLNNAFLCMALFAGLDSCIIDPLNESTMETINACKVILNYDECCAEFIESYGGK